MPWSSRRSELDVATSAWIGLAVLALAFAAVSLSARYGDPPERLRSQVAEYLHLVGELGAHDPDSVDYHHGMNQRGPHAPRSLGALALASHRLSKRIRQSGVTADRVAALAGQIDAVGARASQLSGTTFPLDRELKELFAQDLPSAPMEPSQASAELRARLEQLLPGDAPLPQRLAGYQQRFSIPRSRLHDAITRAVDACRGMTRRFMTLPAGESMTIEYVADKPWSGYSVYLGGYQSVMQINRALPLSANDVLMLACHEGYPGHHVYNSLREQYLLRGRGLTELQALPLFSPAGYRAEAVTSAAASMALDADTREQIFRDALFDSAGIDSGEASRYAEVCTLLDRLTPATVPALRAYLAGSMNRNHVIDFLRSTALMESPEPILAYVDKYRAYTFAYTVGREHFLNILARAGRNEEQRWALLRDLILEETSLR